MPTPGVMVHLSPSFNPPVLKGLKVYTDNPFKFDFILDQGDDHVIASEAPRVIASEAKQSLTDGHPEAKPHVSLRAKRSNPSNTKKIASSPRPSVGTPRNDTELRAEAQRLIKYFLAAITVPDNDLWVNLSPYEKDRIIPDAFGKTEMGRDLLAQDYLLKQVTASLIYPEERIGKEFWQKVYAQAQARFGTTNIPVNTFNKVWIVPEKAVVYEHASFPPGGEGKGGGQAVAYVVESKLKVMLEEDYLALEKALPTRGHVPSVMASPENSSVIASEAPRVIASEAKQSFKHAKKIASSLRPSVGTPRNDMSALASQIIRDIVLPQLQKEINEGKNFAPLRQVYNSLILAAWYKKKIKDSILNKIYADQNKVAGVGYVNSVIASEAPRVIASERSERSNPSNTKKIASSPRPSVGTPRNDTEIIYNQYLQAFKKGVFNYIKEDSSVILSPVSPVILKPEGLKDPNVSNAIPRKYFSGGMSLGLTSLNMAQGMTIVHQADIGAADTGMIVTAQVIASAGNPAMSTLEIAGKIIHQLSGAIMPLKGRQIRLTAAQGGSFFGQFQIDFNVLDEHGIGLLKRALGFIVRTEGEKIYVEWDQISELLSDPDPHLSDLKHEMIKKLLSALPPGVIFSFPLFSLPREQRETLFLAAPVGVIFSFPVLDADDLIGHVFSNFEFTVVGLARRSNGKRVRPWSRALKESPMGELLIRSGFSDLHLREGIGQARDREALRRRLDGSFQKEMIMTAVKVRDAAMVESPEREKVVQEIIERMAQAKGGTMGDAGPLRDKVRLHRVRREEVEQPLKLLLEQKISPQSLQAHLEGIIKMVAGSGEGINKRMRQEQGRASHVFIAGVNVSWWFELGQERLAQVRGLAGYFYPLRNDRDPKPRDAMAQELRDIEESLKQWIKEQIVGDGAKRSLDQFSNDWNTDDGPSLLPENIRHVFGNRLMLLAAFRTGEGRIDRLLDKIYAYKEADAYNWPALRRQLFFDAVDLFIAVEQLLDRQPSAQEDEVIKNIEKGTMALLSAFFVSEHAPGGDTYNGEVSTAPVDGDPQKIKVVLAFPNPKTLAGSDQLERIQQYLNQWYKRQGMEAPKPLLTVRREYRDTGGELSSIRYEAQLPFFREASRRASIQVKYENIQEIRYAVISLSSRKTMYVALEESSSITSDGKKYYFAGSGGQGSIYVNPESREIVKIFNKMRSQPEKKHLDKLVEVVRQLRQKYQEEIIDMQEVVLCEDPQGQRDWGIRMPLIPGFHMNLGELLFDGFKDRIKEILGYIDFITDDSSDRHTSFEDTVKNNVVYNDQEGHLVSNDPVDMWIIMDRIEDQELSLQKVGERYAMAYEDQGGEDHWGNITEMRERLVYKILSDVKRDILAKRIRADQLEQESLKRFDQLWENLRVKDAVQYLNSTHKIKAVAQRWGKYLLSSEDSAMQTQSTALSAQNEPGIEEVMKESLKNRRVGLYVLRLAADSGALRLNIIQSSDQKIVGHLTFSVNNAFKRVDITATGFYSVESQGQGTATAILKAIREQLPIGWGVVLQGVVDYKTIYSMLEGISRQEAVKNLFEEEDLEKFEGLWARVQSDPELLKNSPEENLLARKLLRAYALKQPSVEASSTLTDLGANALFIRALRTAGYVNARVVVRDDDTVDIEASTGNPAQASDAAMMREKGGIDLTDGKMPLSVILSEANGRAKNDNGMFPQDDNGIQFDIDPAMIKQWQEAPGFVPGIINIKPVGNLRQFLGLENNASQDQTAML